MTYRFLGVILLMLGTILQLYSNNDILHNAEILYRMSETGRTPCGKLLFAYRDSVRLQKVPCSPTNLSQIWQDLICNAENDCSYILDSSVLSKEKLKLQAEKKMSILASSPWEKEVSKDDFERYILPYRASNELQDFDGDSLLLSEYKPMVKDIDNPIEVFRIICNKVYNTMRECKSLCPYTLDAYTINSIQQVSCEQRCVLLVHILRNLGIPCSIDRLPFWGNYSTVGHAWVVMIFNGKNYVYDNTPKGGIVKEANWTEIEASRFPLRYNPTVKDKYPYIVQNEKQVTKVFRVAYTVNKTSDSLMEYGDLEDVSVEYGLINTIEKSVEGILNNGSVVYLCAFRTGYNWTPIARTRVQNNTAIFNNVNTELLYIIARKNNNKIQAISNPFKGSQPNLEWNPSKEMIKMTCHRKYPVFSHWLNQWGNMIGSVIEGSNIEDFSICDTIGILETMPYGWTELVLTSKGKKYQYVRYHASSKTRTPLAELRFMTNDQIVSGQAISYKVKNPSAAFDNNMFSVCETKHPGYWIGMNFGKPLSIDKIEYIPKNDGNDIVPGHRYELFFYDKEWKSLGSKIALKNELKYYVPENAIYILKDVSTGIEIRPFCYDKSNNTQIWY